MSNKGVRIVEGVHAPTKKTREQVCKLVACGLSNEEISFVLGCLPSDIKLHYEQEIIHGSAMITALVGASMLKQALRGDVNAARFWLQSRAKWTIPQHVELTGKNGGPVEIQARRQLVARVLELAKGARPAETEGPAAGSSVQ